MEFWGLEHGWVTGTRRMCFNSTPLSPKLVGGWVNPWDPQIMD